MKHLSTVYEPRAIVTFTVDEIALMIECSEHHYDGVCKEASAKAGETIMPGRQYQGFLRGMENCVRNAGELYEHRLTFGQLDTIAKILEVGSYLPPEPITVPPGSTIESVQLDTNTKPVLAAGLRMKIRGVLFQLNQDAKEPVHHE